MFLLISNYDNELTVYNLASEARKKNSFPYQKHIHVDILFLW